MSVWSACGASHDAQGRWKNVVGESSWDLIALRICCWRFSRVRSFSAGLQAVLAGAGEDQRLLAVQVVRAGAQVEREPPLAAPPLMSSTPCRSSA
jgi:hypothetical protein